MPCMSTMVHCRRSKRKRKLFFLFHFSHNKIHCNKAKRFIRWAAAFHVCSEKRVMLVVLLVLLLLLLMYIAVVCRIVFVDPVSISFKHFHSYIHILRPSLSFTVCFLHNFPVRRRRSPSCRCRRRRRSHQHPHRVPMFCMLDETRVIVWTENNSLVAHFSREQQLKQMKMPHKRTKKERICVWEWEGAFSPKCRYVCRTRWFCWLQSWKLC